MSSIMKKLCLTFFVNWGIIGAVVNKERLIMKFRERLARFFYGRYGSDQLNMFILIICMLLLLFVMFLPAVPAYILRGFAILLMGLSIFRMLSKKIEKRRRENAVYTKILYAVKSFFIRQFNRIRYIKKYRYRKCPGCKNHLRLPYKKGEHDVKCPRCGKNFTVKL